MNRWLLLALVPSLALADAKSDAQSHVDAATKLHAGNRLAEAASELAIAYALDPRPELLFAIGQVEVKIGNCGIAVAFYNRFLSTNPDNAAGAYDAIEACKVLQPPVEAKGEARRRMDAAAALHQSGHYELARGELAFAYALDPQPQLLFAIGQTEVKREHCDTAIAFYERFLASTPAAGTDEANEAIEVCKGRIWLKPTDKVAPKPATPVAPAQSAPADASWWRDPIGLGLAGGSVAFAITGVVLYTGARGKLDDADAAPSYEAQRALVDSAHSRRNYAALFGGGALALAGAAIYRFMSHGHESAVVVAPATGGGSISWSGRF